MESNGGCCIARYAAGGVYDNTKIDRIMLRFRPIAPKPDRGGGSVSGLESNGGVAFKRAKRRYVKDSSKKYCRKRKVVVSEETNNVSIDFNSFAKESVVNMKTLSLLPESPVFDHLSPQSAKPEVVDLDLALKKKVQQTKTMKNVLITCCNNKVVTPQPVMPMGSCVIVERVTDACGDDGEEVLGRSDEEKKMSLERDTCPGFISDRLNRVTWTNDAYRKMVNRGGGGGGEEWPEMTWLVLKEKLPPCSGSGGGGWCSMLVCRVRVQYTCKERNSLTVPCDVWRMDGGGFAWRLDLQAALSLGR